MLLSYANGAIGSNGAGCMLAGWPAIADNTGTMAELDYSPWRLYPMRIADLDQVLVIEEYSFPTPWQRRMYEQDLSTNQYSRFYVIKHVESGELAAYIGSWFIIDEAHIGTIATKREMRGMRFAEQLIAYSALQASNEGMTYIILEVRTGNKAAVRLYERLGFERVGLRRRYYTDTGEDAYLMVCRELDNLAERLRIDEGVPPTEE